MIWLKIGHDCENPIHCADTMKPWFAEFGLVGQNGEAEQGTGVAGLRSGGIGADAHVATRIGHGCHIQSDNVYSDNHIYHLSVNNHLNLAQPHSPQQIWL